MNIEIAEQVALLESMIKTLGSRLANEQIENARLNAHIALMTYKEESEAKGKEVTDNGGASKPKAK